MNIVQSIRNRMRSSSRAVADEQDLVLYRQLRSAENKLHDTRVLLGRMQEARRKALAEDVPARQDSACQLEELQKEIASVENDVSRLEAEYQHAQMNVRAYFYLGTSVGPRPEAGLMAAQSAQ